MSSDVALSRTGLDHAGLADEELVKRLTGQDIRALEQLYQRHARAVYSLALKLLAEPTAAEEVVQECFLKVWRQPERYSSERGKLLPWLLGIAHHRAVDLLRRRQLERRHRANGVPETSLVSGHDPETQVWGHYQAEVVIRALQSLPDAQRIALELAYLRGMSQSEIATMLGEPLGTIKTRMRLAMQKLRTSPELVALVAEGG